jgi:hypothetical protein
MEDAMRRFGWWEVVVGLGAAWCWIGSAWAAQEGPTNQSDKAIHEPIFRVARLPADESPQPTPRVDVAEAGPSSSTMPVEPAVVRHPLDPAIDLAKSRLDAIRKEIADYQAIMVKRERIDGKLSEPQFAKIKVRNRKQGEAGSVPFSIYMRFLKPKAIRGREVIYVEGQNNGKLAAHDNGLIKLTVYLDPTGSLAMQSSRYPIYEAGIENLVVKLIEKAERDKAAGMCEVEFVETAKINDRPCTKIKVTHPERQHPYDFNVAEVFIDNELQVPIRYAAYSWPRVNGADPELMEEYTYLDLAVNRGFTDADFSTSNPEYEFK